MIRLPSLQYIYLEDRCPSSPLSVVCSYQQVSNVKLHVFKGYKIRPKSIFEIRLKLLRY